MIAKPLVYQIALPVPLRRLFDYLPPPEGTHLPRGTRVKVPFGSRELIGIVMGEQHGSSLPITQLKTILSVCDPFPLFPLSLCSLIEKAAQYYHHPIGEVAFTGLPPSLRLGKMPKPLPSLTNTPFIPSDLSLNSDQQAALDAILQAQHHFQPFLLEGITGSGKTEVYLRASEQCLYANKQILVLIPEISLTPQTLARFQARFGNAVHAYHSRIPSAQRTQIWMRVRSHAPLIIIGTRSAVFLPFDNLGLLIIDEEHDMSFKQHEGFRYSARDIAVLRAQQSCCPVLLGSATPAFETLSNALKGKYKRLSLSQRATPAFLPTVTVLDIRHKKLDGGLSAPLLKRIQTHLEQGGQILLFINRRGFSPTMMCYHCGWIAECSRCEKRLTYHQKSRMLICHHCLHQRLAPLACPDCHAADIHPIGYGTERIEQVLRDHFPTVNIARIDSDATRQKGSLAELLEQAEKNETPLLIGTQILAKGHHFPCLSLVGIVDMDAGLFSTDFRAMERMAQLIIQVAGRAGRVHQAGEVIIQTVHPEHPLLQQILKQDYVQFAEHWLKERQSCDLPPFSHWAILRAESFQSAHSEKLLQYMENILREQEPLVHVLGPIPAPMPKRKGYYRFQLLLQSLHRQPLHALLSYSTDLLEGHPLNKKVRWSLDVDPLEMI